MSDSAMSPHDPHTPGFGIYDVPAHPSDSVAPRIAQPVHAASAAVRRNLGWLQWLAIAVALVIIFVWALSVLRPHHPLDTVPLPAPTPAVVLPVDVSALPPF